MKILIIEDEKDLVIGLRRGLEKKGYLVDVAYDGLEGHKLMEEKHYDCVLLDLNLPGMDGLTLLEKIRAKDNETKILILSARSEVDDKVLGFNLGADDYLSKPFYFVELLARIQNLVKRQFVRSEDCIWINSLCINTQARIVEINEEELNLTALEYRILEYLALFKNQYKSAEEIIEHVWESEPDYFCNSLKVHMSSLRKKIAAIDSNKYIHCKKGIGYNLSDHQ